MPMAAAVPFPQRANATTTGSKPSTPTMSSSTRPVAKNITGKAATARTNHRNCSRSTPDERRNRMTKSTTATRAITARAVPSHSVAGSSRSRAPGMPSGLSGGVSPCTGPGRRGKDERVRQRHDEERSEDPPAEPARIARRVHHDERHHQSHHGEESPGRHPGRRLAQRPGSRARLPGRTSNTRQRKTEADRRVIPLMIQPMRLAGRLETTRAPTRPKPTQVESQIAPSSADS